MIKTEERKRFYWCSRYINEKEVAGTALIFLKDFVSNGRSILLLAMSFVGTILKEEIVIKKIFTIHYFEHAKDYVFEGEQHDFWEFAYVDKGEIEVMGDTQGFRLKQGEMIFHRPNEFHNVWANGKVAPNLVVISFECRSKAMNYFRNKILSIGDFEKNLLSKIIKEAGNAFSSPFYDPNLKMLSRREHALFGCEQLIKLYLTQLFISLIRQGSHIHFENRVSSVVKERSDKDIVGKVIAFMQEHVDENIRVCDMTSYIKLSNSNLKIIFKSQTGASLMEYFRTLKITKAKVLIREENMNFTEISLALGYHSIHYFSRQFKKITGMSPSEYAHSVKAMI